MCSKYPFENAFQPYKTRTKYTLRRCLEHFGIMGMMEHLAKLPRVMKHGGNRTAHVVNDGSIMENQTCIPRLV